MNILHTCANPKPTEESASKQLATAFFTALVGKNPEFNVTNIDLYQSPPPYLSYDAYRGFWLPILVSGYQATDKEVTAMHYAQTHGKMFNEADVLVLTMPMWNYGLPAIVKAWIDQLIAPNITFVMEEDGPRPLHHMRKVILLAASGGTYKEDDPRECLTKQLYAAFSFIGITDIAIAWADGQNPLIYNDSEMRKAMAIEAAEELAEEVAEMD